MPRLRLLNGPNVGTVYELSGGEVLGRGSSADVVLADTNVSRKHCRVVKVDPYFFLVDLGSQNGTLVNGAKVDKALLRHGDVLTTGDTELRYEDARAEVRAYDLSETDESEAPPPRLSGGFGRDPRPQSGVQRWDQRGGQPVPAEDPFAPTPDSKAPAVDPFAPPPPADPLEPVPPGDPASPFHEPEAQAPDESKPDKPEERILDRLGRDLTQLAREGRLDPLIGRRDELRRLGRILLQRRKPSAILVGDPGVGKTCLVEGLAQQIVAEDGPIRFRTARVVELAIGDLVAGTKYRGEMEERVQRLIRELQEEDDLILFLDELHLLMGLGRTEHSNVDVANLLKPILARGGVRLIGATTPEEYERHVARDRAFARRFEVVWIEEPSRNETLQILARLKSEFEDHHQVEIEESAFEAAVDLSRRYLPDRRLPDKALDLIDQACARAILGTFRRVEDAAQKTFSIGRGHVADVVAERCRVPRDRLLADDEARLEGLGDALRERVIGQEPVIEALVAALRSARAGLHSPDRPLASFLFVGPSGVGKTELAKALAEYLFDDDDLLIRVDMSELMERHSVSKLIGAPPGYVGHGEEGQLTGPIRRTPYAVLLLDEVEKAHPQVLDVLLQLLDEGRVTDSLGRPASYREAIVILSSNLGASPEAQGRGGLGFAQGPSKQISQMREALEKQLRPELLNRIDRVLEFAPLDLATLEAVVEREVELIRKRLEGRVEVEVGVEARRALAERGYDPRYGARELRREVERTLSQPLAEALVAGRLLPGARVRLLVQDGELILDFEPSDDPPAEPAT
ncbi:MAG: AAA family ATPase [Planctomycetes bacterium]|nr:AAA family ATPase [Planctomycetota bacterium]